MGCAGGKDVKSSQARDADNENSSFDPKLLQDSWDRIRGGRNKKKTAVKRTLTRRRARNRSFNRDGEDDDYNGNWEKLIPTLIEGFDFKSDSDIESAAESVSFLGVTKRRKKKKKIAHKARNDKPLLSRKEALAGISALDLLVRAADDADRLDAVLEHLGRSVGEWSRELEVAERLINENLKAMKNAVAFLLDRNLKLRGAKKQELTRTWLKFIDHCCRRILNAHARACEERQASPFSFDAFSSAAKKFLKDNLWMLLTVGYQLGTLLWRFSNRGPAIEGGSGSHDPTLGTNAHVNETIERNQGVENDRMTGLTRPFR